jgi:cytochrome oxidase assembly protein ShyY1
LATEPTPSLKSEAPVRKRRGFPVVPTVMAAIAVPILIGFGVWQLQRAEWKEALLAKLARNADLPPVTLGNGFDVESMLFRRARAELQCDSPATPRAGRNMQGEPGYSFLFPCRAAGQLLAVNAGWAPRPDSPQGLLPPAGQHLGVVAPADPSKPARMVFYLVAPQPPLVASAPPSLDTIPNNHLSYAIQWFSFAAILAVIYGLWLRRWLATSRPPA